MLFTAPAIIVCCFLHHQLIFANINNNTTLLATSSERGIYVVGNGIIQHGHHHGTRLFHENRHIGHSGRHGFNFGGGHQQHRSFSHHNHNRQPSSSSWSSLFGGGHNNNNNNNRPKSFWGHNNHHRQTSWTNHHHQSPFYNNHRNSVFSQHQQHQHNFKAPSLNFGNNRLHHHNTHFQRTILGGHGHHTNQHNMRFKTPSLPPAPLPHQIAGGGGDALSRLSLGLGAAIGSAMMLNKAIPVHSSSSVILPNQIAGPQHVTTRPVKTPGRAFQDLEPKCGIRPKDEPPRALFNNNLKVVKREATITTNASSTTTPVGKIYVYAYAYEYDNDEEKVAKEATTLSAANLPEDEPTGDAMYRITGGVAVENTDSLTYPPWQASLRFQDAHICGGSLISSRFIVTAAHCFKETSSDPAAWSVYLGKVRRNLGEPTEIGPLRVISVAVHPEYGDKFNKRFDADIALLYLEEPVRYNRHAFPICLPQQGQNMQPGQICIITGFGTTKDTGAEGKLKEANVPIIDSNRCRNSSERMAKALTDSMFCAGYLGGGVDACQGDSGGPLACPSSANGDVFVLSGIISWGFDCGAANAPGVYTRVSKFVSWIKQTKSALTAAYQAGGGTIPAIADPIQ